MTTRMLVLILTAGVLVWARHALLSRHHRDRTRGSRALPAVPSALRAGGSAWIVFTTPLCRSCDAVQELLNTHRPGERVVIVDASRDPELASRWDIKRAPTTLHADDHGKVTARLVGVDAVRSAVYAEVTDTL